MQEKRQTTQLYSGSDARYNNHLPCRLKSPMRAISSLWPRFPGPICRPRGLPIVAATTCAKAATFLSPALVHFSTCRTPIQKLYVNTMLRLCFVNCQWVRERLGHTGPWTQEKKGGGCTLRTLVCLVCSTQNDKKCQAAGDREAH